MLVGKSRIAIFNPVLFVFRSKPPTPRREMFGPPGKGSQVAQGARGARTPEEAECSRIPIGPFRRSASLRLRGERSHRALAGRSLEASPVGPGGFPPFPAITEARESDASPPRGPPAQMSARQRSLVSITFNRCFLTNCLCVDLPLAFPEVFRPSQFFIPVLGS